MQATAAVFFIPTVDLVGQQARAIEDWILSQNAAGADPVLVARYHSGLSAPDMTTSRVLVSTPSAFLALQDRNADEFVREKVAPGKLIASLSLWKSARTDPFLRYGAFSRYRKA